MRSACITAILCSAGLWGQQLGRIEGRVTSTNGEPVRKATVRLQGIGAAQGQQIVSYVEISGADGSFAFADMPAGRYLAMADKVGFTPARAPGNLVLAAGETATGLTLRLSPLGVISGEVTDRDGDPVPGAVVTLSRYRWTPSGLQLQRNLSDRTDDRGVYRISNVEPGRYRVSATATGQAGAGPNERRGPSAQEVDLQTYYPSEVEAQRAQAIDVKPGAEVANVRIRMRQGRTYSVSGVMIDGTTNQPASGNLSIAALDDPGTSRGSANARPKGDGSFRFNGLTPGEYAIQAMPNGGTREQPGLSGRLAVNLGTQDASGLVLRLMPNFEVNGRVSVEGSDFRSLLGGAATDRNQLPRISIVSTGGPFSNSYSGNVEADGVFHIGNVMPSRYLLESSLGGRAYVKSVRVGGQDVSQGALDFSQGAPGMLDVVLATDMAQMTFSSLPSASDSISPTVVAWPKTKRVLERSAGVRVLRLDTGVGTGGPRLAGLPPGDYYVAFFPELDLGLAQAWDFIVKFNDSATGVTLKGGENVTVEPKTISSEAVEAAIASLP